MKKLGFWQTQRSGFLALKGVIFSWTESSQSTHHSSPASHFPSSLGAVPFLKRLNTNRLKSSSNFTENAQKKKKPKEEEPKKQWIFFTCLKGVLQGLSAFSPFFSLFQRLSKGPCFRGQLWRLSDVHAARFRHLSAPETCRPRRNGRVASGTGSESGSAVSG